MAANGRKARFGKYRDPRTGRRMGPFPGRVTRGQEPIRLDDGRMLAEMIPACARETLGDALKFCAYRLREVHTVSFLCAMPAEKGMEEFTAHGDEIADLNIDPYLISEARRQEDDSVLERPLFRIEPNPDVPMEELVETVGLLTLAPQVLRALLATIKPWHLAVLGVEGFEDQAPPSPEDAAAFVAEALVWLDKVRGPVTPLDADEEEGGDDGGEED